MFKKGGDFVIFSPNEALLYKNPITKDKSCDHLVFGKPSMKEKKKEIAEISFPSPDHIPVEQSVLKLPKL